jgi:hypothetical protein
MRCYGWAFVSGRKPGNLPLETAARISSSEDLVADEVDLQHFGLAAEYLKRIGKRRRHWEEALLNRQLLGDFRNMIETEEPCRIHTRSPGTTIQSPNLNNTRSQLRYSLFFFPREIMD